MFIVATQCTWLELNWMGCKWNATFQAYRWPLPMTEIEILYANFELNKRSCQTNQLNSQRTNERTATHTKNRNECKRANKQEISESLMSWPEWKQYAFLLYSINSIDSNSTQYYSFNEHFRCISTWNCNSIFSSYSVSSMSLTIRMLSFFCTPHSPPLNLVLSHIILVRSINGYWMINRARIWAKEEKLATKTIT